MSVLFTVIDCRSTTIDPIPRPVQAATPEQAGEIILGIPLQRAHGKKAKDTVARVYWQHEGQSVSMVRLYAKSEAPAQ